MEPNDELRVSRLEKMTQELDGVACSEMSARQALEKDVAELKKPKVDDASMHYVRKVSGWLIAATVGLTVLSVLGLATLTPLQIVAPAIVGVLTGLGLQIFRERIAPLVLWTGNLLVILVFAVFLLHVVVIAAVAYALAMVFKPLRKLGEKFYSYVDKTLDGMKTKPKVSKAA